MKLGLLTSILESWTFEEVLETAASLGLPYLETACWPKEKAARRYAGTSHIDVERVVNDRTYADYIRSCLKEKGITLTSLAYYPNVMDPENGAAAAAHLQNVIRASAILEIGMTTTFIGRDQYLTAEENLKKLPAIWNPILMLAEAEGVRIGIENCPMLFGPEQWPGGQNLMTSPDLWRRIFDILPSDNLGLNFDPSHFVWQGLDYVKAVYDFRDKLFHIHFKDIKMFPEKLSEVGTMAYPLSYMAPKIPGLGDVRWGDFISALTEVGYDGYAVIEVEDRAFESGRDRILDSIRLSKRYLENFVI